MTAGSGQSLKNTAFCQSLKGGSEICVGGITRVQFEQKIIDEEEGRRLCAIQDGQRVPPGPACAPPVRRQPPAIARRPQGLPCIYFSVQEREGSATDSSPLTVTSSRVLNVYQTSHPEYALFHFPLHLLCLRRAWPLVFLPRCPVGAAAVRLLVAFFPKRQFPCKVTAKGRESSAVLTREAPLWESPVNQRSTSVTKRLAHLPQSSPSVDGLFCKKTKNPELPGEQSPPWWFPTFSKKH